MPSRSLMGWKRGSALLAAAAAVLALLAGCAGEALHKEGLASLAEGRYEEGLQKLSEATTEAPENLSFRSSLLRNREVVLAGLLAMAGNERSNGRTDEARAIYERMLTIDPGSVRAREGLDALAMDKRHEGALALARDALKKGEAERARLALKQVLIENPRNPQAVQMQRQLDEEAARERLAAPVLEGKFKNPVTLQFRDANLKMVLEALSRTSGINILLDKDVKTELKTSIFVKDISVEDTINLILLQSQLEKKILGENTIFVYPNTPAKLKDYQDLKVRSFHLSSADPKQMQTMIKSLLKTKDIFINEKTNSLVMRDTPDAIRVAERMIADQDFEEPEVMLEVEVLEVARERLTDLGIKFPSQLAFTAAGGTGPGGALTVTDLRSLNGDRIVTSPALGMALNLKLVDSDTNVLASPRIRAKNREKAKIMIGDRVPVITNAITPVSTGTPVVTGNVQYLDVGLKLEVEPDIHLNSEVVIKVNLDVSSIIKEVQNAQSGTLAYQVGTRNTSTVLRLKDGETQILAGLISSEEQRSAAKVPLIGQLPILGRLFSDHSGDAKKTEIVLSITPRIVGTPHLPRVGEVEYWSGTEGGLRSELLAMRSVGSISGSGAGAAAAVRALGVSPQLPAIAPRTLAAAAVAPVPPQGAPAQQGVAPNPAAAAAVPAAGKPAAVPAAASPAEEGAAPLLFSWQGPSRAKVGDKISVTLNAQANRNLSGIGFLVHFDPKVLKVADVAEGSFLMQANPESALKNTVDPQGGQIEVDKPAAGSRGATGSGSVTTMQFEVIAAARQSHIGVSRIAPSGADGEPFAVAAPEPHTFMVAP